MVKAKSKMGMKIFVAALCMLLLASILAIPASAATIRNGSYYMNLYGNVGTNLQGRSVTLYGSGSGVDQQFATYYYAGELVIVNTQSYSYALNRHSGNGTCIMWSLSTGLGDSKLSRAGSIIELKNWPATPLLAPGRYNGAVLTWGGPYGYDTWTWA